MQGNENAVVVYPCSRLSGEIRLQGAKNSVLPVMAAALLNKGISVFKNCPEIADVYIMAELLKICGCKVVFELRMRKTGFLTVNMPRKCVLP